MSLSRISALTFLLVLMALLVQTAEGQDPLLQFDQLRRACRYAEAERLAREQKEHFERNSPSDLGSNFRWCQNLGRVYFDLGRYEESEPLLKRALALAEKLWPAGHIYVTPNMIDLADLYLERSRYDLARPLYEEALARRERGLLMDPAEQAGNLRIAAAALRAQGMNELAAEVERTARDTAAGDQKALRKVNSVEVSESLDRLGRLSLELGNYGEAEKKFLKALEIREDVWGPLQGDVATSMDHLGRLYLTQGQFVKAETRFKQALDIREQVFGQHHVATALGLVNLADFYLNMGRLAEAESLLQRAMSIHHASRWMGHPQAATAFFLLAGVHAARGRFAESDLLHRQALAIRKNVFSARHKSLAQSYDALARLDEQHGRLSEAESLAKESLESRLYIFGSQHIETAAALARLGGLQLAGGFFDEAEASLEKALTIRKSVLGDKHPDVARSLADLAGVSARRGDLSRSVELLSQALALIKAKLGPSHGDTLATAVTLAGIHTRQRKLKEASQLLQEFQSALLEPDVMPERVSDYLLLKARLAWQENNRQQAVEHLEEAISAAEKQRLFAAGSEKEQGALFGRFADLYHLMFVWQVEQGDLAKAFAFSERNRARALFDQMEARGVDPFAGLSPAEREALRRKNAVARMRAAGLVRQLQTLQASSDQTAEHIAQTRQNLQTQLRRAQDQVSDCYRELRAKSRSFQLAGGAQFHPAELAAVKQFAADSQALVLSFIATQDDLFILAISADAEPMFVRGELSDELAAKLGMPAGRLAADRLRELFRVEGTDLSELLARPHLPPKAETRLAALWEILIPPAKREGIVQGKYELLVILPDGPLTRLPMEALIVETGASPQYLLDAGPPVICAPSATVLLQLASRPAQKHMGETVLTMGNPTYLSAGNAGAAGESPLAAIEPAKRFASIGGALEPLPYTDVETQWVAEVFRKKGLGSIRLTKGQATEAAFRTQSAGKEVLHLACHGLCDQHFANLFGALALTPGKAGNPADDGFLTLAEIYELDLSATELAILSACETNAGPQQNGEGVWALSRGFLVAGSRRVVASNWLVDDESGASLVSHYSSHLAESRRGDGAMDFAAALHKAKQAIRRQDRWSAPHFWAGMIHIGPN